MTWSNSDPPFSYDALADAAAKKGVSLTRFRQIMETLIVPEDEDQALVEAIDGLKRQEAVADLVMWVHDTFPELCTCDQCGYQRADIERIRKMHGV